MYKNLDAAALGVSGRQSEMVELAMTYGFRGLTVDANEMLKRAAKTSPAEASRYLTSAKLRVNGLKLPIDLYAEDFAAETKKLDSIAETAKAIGFDICEARIAPSSDRLPFHENFELCRARLAEAGEVLAKHGIRLGVSLQAAIEQRAGREFGFIHTAEEILTLLKTIGGPNVGLILDTWNWTVGGGGFDQLGELSGRQLVAVRLADVPDDADHSSIAVSKRLMPGEESIAKYGELLGRWNQEGFKGPVTLLPHPSKLEGVRDANVQTAKQVLEQIWMAAGISKPTKPAAVGRTA